MTHSAVAAQGNLTALRAGSMKHPVLNFMTRWIPKNWSIGTSQQAGQFFSFVILRVGMHLEFEQVGTVSKWFFFFFWVALAKVFPAVEPVGKYPSY